MKQQNASVTTVTNGKEAITAVQKQAYDLVLMDIQMPVLDGLSATRAIKKLSEPRLQDLPILAMTAHAMDSDRKKSLKPGMNGHLTKPLDPDILFSEIIRWTSRS